MQNGQPIPKEFGGWCCFFSIHETQNSIREMPWVDQKVWEAPIADECLDDNQEHLHLLQGKNKLKLSSSQYCLNIITILCSQCIYFNVKRDYKILLNVFWHFVKCPTWGQANVIRWPDSPRFSLTKIKTLHCFAGVYMSELIMSPDFISEIWSPHNVIKLADS